ncbi:MAG: Ig-like domain-containing protein [Clostridiales Family XIII bacterium]|jgi:hypothetical protein|nr:Ig-like domain-containing protein [Clostridiales Family XIII bacterium]
MSKKIRVVIALIAGLFLLFAAAMPGFAATTPPAVDPPSGGTETPPQVPDPGEAPPEQPPEPPPAQKPAVTLEIKEYPSTMVVGEKGYITYILRNSDGDTKVQFSSGRPDVVSVDAEGNLEALSVGSADITVRVGTEKISRLIQTVAKRIEAEEIKIEVLEFGAAELIQDIHKLKVGDRLHLSAILEPADADDSGLTWSVSDESVLSLNSDVVLTAKTEGNAEVQVNLNGLSAVLVFSVLPDEEGTPLLMILLISAAVILIAAAVIVFFVLRKKKDAARTAAIATGVFDGEADSAIPQRTDSEIDDIYTNRNTQRAEEMRDDSRMTKVFDAPLIIDSASCQTDAAEDPFAPKKSDAGYEDGPDKRFLLDDIE